jgi:hypothetical protein
MARVIENDSKFEAEEQKSKIMAASLESLCRYQGEREPFVESIVT